MATTINSPETPWWKGAVIYQIYPRSFRDTNGDGVGDLKGVIDGVDYVASLGVDAIWLSPFFTSPMDDFGYDVSDYCDVDPLFGVLSDFDALIDKAHGLGLKVIIDQVYSHTSDQHAWFQESRASRDNAKSDWYVWSDAKLDGAPPNNWQSVFGGGAWEWDARRGQYYFHNFLTSQPDLNLHNKDVQSALLDVARFWLDRGVDGFRLDAINFAMHDPQLRDNPPAKNRSKQPTRPFDFQDHRFSMSHPDIEKFLARLRDLTDDYDGSFTVAEVVGPDVLDEMKLFTQSATHLSSAYNFAFLYADKISTALIKTSLMDWPGDNGEGWPSWAFSNHDAPRAVSRWAEGRDHDLFAKSLLLLLLSMRGNAFVYQGEELGLPQANIPFELLRDPEAIKNWPETLGRDGARTPLPWSKTATNAGFSKDTPWLPVDQEHYARSIDVQTKDENSVLAFTKACIALRKSSPALSTGTIGFLESPNDIVAFTRGQGDKQSLCVFNLGQTQTRWRPENHESWRIDLTSAAGGPQNGALPEDLLPGEAYLASRSQ